jgi:protein TIF31
MQNNIRAHHDESIEEKENVQHELESSLEASKDGFKGELDVHPPVVSEENCAVHDEQKQANVLSPEEYSDEGWQAATLRGRSANVKKKNSHRKPALTKLFVDRFEEGHTGSAHRTGSQPQTKGGKEDIISAPSQLSFGSFLKADKSNGDPSNDEDKSGNAAAKPDLGAKPTGINRPTSIASKFVSYKDVAVSPPGTVLKPLLEQKEAKDKDNGLDSDLTLSSGEEDRKFTEKNKKPDDESSKEVVSSPDGVSHVETTPDSNSDESPSATKKTSGSNLSASAPPFNPGSLLSMSHPYSTVAIYDASAVLQPIPSQAMEILPQAIDTRVPRGPRSTVYYRTELAFQRKRGYTTHIQSTILRGNNSPTTMNPHAAEFVPGKTLQQSDAANGEPSHANPGIDDSAQVATSLTADEVKGEMPAEDKTDQVEKVISGKGKENRGKDATRNAYKTELARQILLSFMVKSVHDSLGSAGAELDRKPSVSDEVNVEQSSNISNSCSDRKEFDKQQKATEVPKGQKDTDGFTVVSKRRRRQQQFMNPINGLYSQQSICTSVS